MRRTLAILALACGYYFGLNFLDPLCGLVGAAVIVGAGLLALREARHAH